VLIAYQFKALLVYLEYGIEAAKVYGAKRGL